MSDLLKGEVNFELSGWGASFKGGASMKQLDDKVYKQNKVLISSRAYCYTYNSALNIFDLPKFS